MAGEEEMVYETPRVTDLGSIQRHTFTNTGQVPGVGPSHKDTNVCTLDKFSEYSCGDHVS